MKKILLTGFGPFGDIAINPSETLVKQLHQQLRTNNSVKSEAMILPVDYQKAGAIVDELDFFEYDFVFQFGIAAGRRKISLERVALNWIESEMADISGINLSPCKIVDGNADALFNTLPLSEMSQQLNQKFKNTAEVSFSAGAYLCNYVYYKSLGKSPNCLFTHIPMTLANDQDELNCQNSDYQERLVQVSLDIIGLVLNS